VPPEWWSAVSRPAAASPPQAAPAADPGALLSAAPAYTGPRTGAPVAPHWGLATQAAQKHGLDPSLLAAVWDFESSGNPGAINKSSGATGLGQVMPRERGFPDRPTQRELLDPATNAEWSARILKSGLDRYGNEDKALAAYLGAIDARGNITGAVDANGTGGNQYIRTVRERQQRYTAGGTPAPVPAAPLGGTPAAQGGPAWWQAVARPASSPGPGTTVGAPAARPPATGPSEPGSAPGQQPGWLDLASSQLGKPYIWGSKGGRSDFSRDAAGFDCSGFVSYVYKNSLGVDVPAFTGSAYPATRAVEAQEAQPGDLVFWNMGTPDPRRQHVAIYIGGGKVIQSGGQGDGVNIAPVGQMPGAEFRRVPAAAAALARTPSPTGTTAGAPDAPGAVWLQGTVARTPAAPPWWAAVTGGRS
jgi:cell wall-associated NlpC family hydrolase